MTTTSLRSPELLKDWLANAPKELLVELHREKVERDGLRGFLPLAWPVIEGRKKYVTGWHLDAISDHLTAVSAGQIKNLLINEPPRHMKSTQVSVGWPAHDWISHPERQWLFASYGQNLSIRDSVKCRRVIESPWYQGRWGDRFRLTSDQNTKGRFENDKGGYRLATSVGGGLTGEGGDIIVVDDAHNVQETESGVQRQVVLDWWDRSMSTRLNDPRTGAYVIVMQRIHERDLAGHILANEMGWDHLCLPAEYEPNHIFQVRSSIGFKDPRTKAGQLLWPERFGKKEMATLKTKLGSYGTAGQLQQRPSPDDGGLFKKGDFRLWPAEAPLPVFQYVVQSYDTAFTDQTQNDPCGFHCWGIFTPPTSALTADRFDRSHTDAPRRAARSSVMLIDRWVEHIESADLLERAVEEYETEYGAPDSVTAHARPLIGPPPREKGRTADVVIIEDKGSGITLRQALARRGIPVIRYNPGNIGKMARAHFAAPYAEAGLVWLPESPKKPGQPRVWAQQFLNQLAVFPNGEHDEDVDCFTQAIRVLVDHGWLLHEQEEAFQEQDRRRVEAEDRPTVGIKENPYAR